MRTSRHCRVFRLPAAVQEVVWGPRIPLLVDMTQDVSVDEWPRGMLAIELALLRRGVANRDCAHERCSGCLRTPLIGERVYPVEGGAVLCELCRGTRGGPKLPSRVVRAPGLGRAIRVLAEGVA